MPRSLISRLARAWPGAAESVSPRWRRRPTRRLLFVYRFCGLGGVETSILTRLNALPASGIEATAVFTEFYGRGGDTIAGHDRVRVIPVGAPELPALLREEFDALSVVDHPEFVDLVAACGLDVPILFETQSSLQSSLPRYYRNLDHPLVRAVIVPSEFNAQLVRKVAAPRREIFLVPNAVDPRTFRPRRVCPNDVVPEWSPAERIVLWVGRLEDEKNPAELCAIGRRALARDRHLRFVMVGDTPDYDAYRARLEALLTMEERRAFTFLRAVPNAVMPDLYAAAATSGGLFVSTSCHESSPMTMLEAMACGCPVLSTNVGGVPELIEHGRSGSLYRTGAVEQAVDLLLWMVSNAARTRVDRMIRRARAEVERNHSPGLVARRYSELLRAIPARAAATA